MRMIRVFAMLVSVVPLACGADSPASPTLTLELRLTSALEGSQPDLRAALVWLPAGPIGHPVVRELAIRPGHGGNLEVEIRESPPEEALGPLWDGRGFASDARGASANVVVYEDRNHNGRLDVLDLDGPGARQFADHVLGDGGSRVVTYLEGPGLLPPSKPGFSLVELFNSGGVVAARVASSLEVNVYLTGDPELDRLNLCPRDQSTCHAPGVEPTEGCADAPAAPAGTLLCAYGDGAAQLSGCHDAAALGGLQVCVGDIQRVPRPQGPSLPRCF